MNNEDRYQAKFSYEREAKDGSKHYEAFKIAVENRKFEIEMYWKRATYFWAFIAVIFLGYWATHTPGSENEGSKGSAGTLDEVVGLLLPCLGFLLSLAWYLVNRGSKKWQENWEFHIDHLEDKVTGPLYKSVFNRAPAKGRWGRFCRLFVGPSKHSVSTINQLVSLYITAVWALIILYAWKPSSLGLIKQVLAGGTIVIALFMIFSFSSKRDPVSPPHCLTEKESKIED